jgi:predicted nucleic acid-binding protein
MSDRFFLDTNILVYAYDEHDREKQKKAQSILVQGIEKENICLSVQVLGEFFSVVTRRIHQIMSLHEAKEIISFFSILPIQEIDFMMVQRAIDTQEKYGLSYRDSLIIAAAERANCQTVLSEDLSDGQNYHSVAVSNPFKEKDIV